MMQVANEVASMVLVGNVMVGLAFFHYHCMQFSHAFLRAKWQSSSTTWRTRAVPCVWLPISMSCACVNSPLFHVMLRLLEAGATKVYAFVTHGLMA